MDIAVAIAIVAQTLKVSLVMAAVLLAVPAAFGLASRLFARRPAPPAVRREKIEVGPVPQVTAR